MPTSQSPPPHESPFEILWIIPRSGNKKHVKMTLIGGNVSNRGCDRHTLLTPSPWITTL